MNRLREANRAVVGAVALILIVGAVLGAFYFQDLPLIGGGTTYSAQFSEAAGLKPDSEVRIAGVKAGQVTRMKLEGKHVRVDFRIDGAWLHVCGGLGTSKYAPYRFACRPEVCLLELTPA